MYTILLCTIFFTYGCVFFGSIHDDGDGGDDANGVGVIDNDESIVFRARNLCNMRMIWHKLTVNSRY